MIKSLFAAILFVQWSLVAFAADFYASPTGSGKLDGSSWDNAIPQSKIQATFNTVMAPGDRLYLAGGTYDNLQLHLKAGGTDGARKSIIGVIKNNALPKLLSTWSIDKPDKGATAILIDQNVSYLTIEHVSISNYQYGIRTNVIKTASKGVKNTFRNITMIYIRHGFYMSNSSYLVFENCNLCYYSKHGFRFKQACYGVRVAGCTADCSMGDVKWEEKTEALPFGFTINDSDQPNSDFVFENCIARNNMMPMQKNKYKNGDGFVVEGSAKSILFMGCQSIRNQDAGYDLKTPKVILLDCIAINNKRNYRIWTTGELSNCYAVDGRVGLWCNGGPVAVVNSCFYSHAEAAIMTDDKAIAPVTLSSSEIIDCDVQIKNTASGSVKIIEK